MVTSVTLGDETVSSLATRIRRLRNQLRSFYGKSRVRQLVAMRYTMLVGAYTAHRHPDRLSETDAATRSVWQLMFAEAGHMAPRATD